MIIYVPLKPNEILQFYTGHATVDTIMFLKLQITIMRHTHIIENVPIKMLKYFANF